MSILNSKLGWLTEWDGLDGWAENICQSAQTSRLNWFRSVNFTFEKLLRIGETSEKYLRNITVSNSCHQLSTDFLKTCNISLVDQKLRQDRRQYCRNWQITEITDKNLKDKYIKALTYMVERIKVPWRCFLHSIF